ncbi:hypothetical protein OPU71_16795 [Niveibacterium sp. 24ML]|uniref:hypothetical protein n=1 Tax=Niveibacterium sp. 24ML TaxID=2985512 RepID=UPI002270CE08|nr:hypothetical protein [Niveibacterium sp. 24ML]MCX9157783.1 hypothetical protein [Niveibacterium sp. 24ML]
MFWIVLLLGGLSLTFAQLGALSVTVTFLSIALRLALLALIGIGAVALLRRIFPKEA